MDSLYERRVGLLFFIEVLQQIHKVIVATDCRTLRCSAIGHAIMESIL